MDTAYLCGTAGCLAEGVALVAAILILVLIGWIYVTWQNWAVRHLEEMEQDIQRTRWLREIEKGEPERDHEEMGAGPLPTPTVAATEDYSVSVAILVPRQSHRQRHSACRAVRDRTLIT